jgi:hypothetical protein
VGLRTISVLDDERVAWGDTSTMLSRLDIVQAGLLVLRRSSATNRITYQAGAGAARRRRDGSPPGIRWD